MKEFAVYTGLRVLVFVASVITVMLIWSLIIGSRDVPRLPVFVVGFAISGVVSYFLLNRQRDAFARRVEERAARATAAFEQRNAREDRD
ncbi:MAG: hypothetical protein JWN68_3611 [Nocardioides sp.]|uniref:DUF4229 domain-containing protein n=1 Tax=Nocardioides sp. TaxID=35761 RepID=UPI00260334D2|nr:DUF4229 domain-containing protein [Nocardioides sp.]MCW2835658.1 hypothetical protein [Nocardioides sp.]